MLVTNGIANDPNKLLGQWLSDINSLNGMVAKMQLEIVSMKAEGASVGRILMRQEMIDQYKTTIAKLQTLVDANNI